MALRFKSADGAFHDLLRTLAGQLVSGAEILAEVLEHDADRADIAERMREAEHAADETTHALASKVSATFVTPFDREDIYALASALDDVMDDMEEAVDLIALYRVGELPEAVAEQVEVLQRCAELTLEAMPRLESRRDLAEYWIEINRLENAGDRSFRRILATLFDGSYDAMEVLKLKDVVEALESAVDGFERIANIVEQIHAKEST